ncbi:hypothetical protein ACFSJY_07835 [Thalassotalea euphylliae]|uniref:hypothetical protein n=1 Tax=Thalassotalea euphylliae TaxID=1655234 RepID=UPI003637797B
MFTIVKTLAKALTLFSLMAICTHSYAALVFEFNNNEFPEVDFVGIESSDVHLSFGPDLLDIGDSFDLLIGATPGTSELVAALDVSFNENGIPGFSFGNTLNLIPQTDQFFVTIVEKNGSFNLSSVNAYFSNNGVGANFHGVAFRPDDAVQVSEPTSITLILLVLSILWVALLSNSKHNA